MTHDQHKDLTSLVHESNISLKVNITTDNSTLHKTYDRISNLADTHHHGTINFRNIKHIGIGLNLNSILSDKN